MAKKNKALQNNRKPSRKNPASVPKKYPQKNKNLLILECDSLSLEVQKLTFGLELYEHWKSSFPAANIRLVRVETKSMLLDSFSKLAEELLTFDTVVIVGHSNTSASGLHLYSRLISEPWQALANWLSPFQPKKLFLIVCGAGKWSPSETLFAGIDTLQEIHASPFNINIEMASVLKLIVPIVRNTGNKHQGLLAALRVANFVKTKGVLICHTRKDFDSQPAIKRRIMPPLEEAAKVLWDKYRRT